MIRFARDIGAVIVIAIVALGVGFGVNRMSANPLPTMYQTPEQRFDAQLTRLVAAPPFPITPNLTVNLDEFHSAVSGHSTTILDARPSVFYERGHVPGALNLARDDFAKDYSRLAPVLKPDLDKPIIVYCAGGECHDSKMVAGALLALGFSKVRVFTGGWDEWSAAGLPTVKGTAP